MLSDAYYVQSEKELPANPCRLVSVETTLIPRKTNSGHYETKVICFLSFGGYDVFFENTFLWCILSINLRKLEFSPSVNPLVEPQQIQTKERLVKSGRTEQLINSTTGEIAGVTAIHQVEERDDAEFVKVFAAGVAASYDLGRTAQRVFQIVLDQYQRTPMAGGFADAVELFWFGEGIGGRDIGMSEKTFQRGLKDLLAKSFLAPRSPNTYWVNPALFFKGDRVMFIREYRRKQRSNNGQREELERHGQIRLTEV